MAVQKMASGRWRAIAYDKRTGKQIAVRTVLPDEPKEGYRNKTEAQRAVVRAQTALQERREGKISLREFYENWVEHGRPDDTKESTWGTYASQCKTFVARYGHQRVDSFTANVAKEFMREGGTRSNVNGLRVLFSAIVYADLLATNPFSALSEAKRGGGKKKRQAEPAKTAEVERMLEVARELTPLSYYAWLLTASHTGARPGELDAMRWEYLDEERGIYEIQQEDGQWNAHTRGFTSPKNGRGRPIAVEDVVLDVLADLPRESPFIFTTLRGTHFTPSSRSTFWTTTRLAAGLAQRNPRTGKITGKSLYRCTRHYYGWRAINVLHMPTHVVADQLGHTDGGALVATLYGHPDRYVSIERMRTAANAHTRSERKARLRVVA